MVDLEHFYDQVTIAKINSDVREESKVARVVEKINRALCKEHEEKYLEETNKYIYS